MQQGFILTPYFYESLVQASKKILPGLSNAYGDLVSKY